MTIEPVPAHPAADFDPDLVETMKPHHHPDGDFVYFPATGDDESVANMKVIERANANRDQNGEPPLRVIPTVKPSRVKRDRHLVISRIRQLAPTHGIAPAAVFTKRQGTRSERYEQEKRAKALLFRALYDDDGFSYGEIGSAIGWTQEAVIYQVKKGRALTTADPAADPEPGSRLSSARAVKRKPRVCGAFSESG